MLVGRPATLLARNAVLVVLVLTFVVFSFALPDTFFTVGNVRTMVNSQAVVLLLAVAATIPLRAGDMDFSVAGVLTASAAVLAALLKAGWPLPLAILVVLALGLLVGLINSLMTVVIGVDSFVVSLGLFTALNGMAYAVTNSQVIANIPPSLSSVASTIFFGFPALTWYAWLVVVVIWYVYEKAPAGRYLLFVGGNRNAAALAGIRVGRVRTLAFLSSGLLAALAGVLLAGSLGAVDPSIGPQYLLLPFAAAFLGATTVQVGRFNAIGTIVALYLLVVGVTGLQLLGASGWVGDVFNGLALVLSVGLAKVAERRRK